MKIEDDYTALAESLFRLINYRSSVQKRCANLGDMECRFLNLLAGLEDPVSMNFLADQLRVSHSRITRLVDSMVKKGFVLKEQSLDDKRKWQVFISRDGADAYRSLSGVTRELQATLLSRLPPDRIDEIYRHVKLYIDTYHEILNEKDAELESVSRLIPHRAEENTGLIW